MTGRRRRFLIANAPEFDEDCGSEVDVRRRKDRCLIMDFYQGGTK
jgi:hypothetical protein